MRFLEFLAALRHFPLSPKILVVGVLIGFGTLCFLGRKAAVTDKHEGFVRLTQWVAPETKYYPTVNELMSIVRSAIKPDQILVIVGGNSVTRGVGQPADKIWTKRLQTLLGDGYCVVNLAFNGSLPTDGGAVVAEALRFEFPRQIYIANAAPTQAPNPEGSLVYRFVFWDAWAKGLLVTDDADRNAMIKESHSNPAFGYLPGFEELRIRNFLDRWFYFQDYWNDITLTRFNTVWAPYFPGLSQFLRARNTFPDPEPDFLAMPIENRYIPAHLEAEMINVRGTSVYAYDPVKNTAGQWNVYQPVWDQFRARVKGVFPKALKKRTLILVSHNSPYYLNKLTPDERERNTLAYDLAVKEWESAGYASLQYGSDFHPTQDYGDRTHLTWKGGEKLAAIVATKIDSMARELGYLKAQSAPAARP